MPYASSAVQDRDHPTNFAWTAPNKNHSGIARVFLLFAQFARSGPLACVRLLTRLLSTRKKRFEQQREKTL